MLNMQFIFCNEQNYEILKERIFLKVYLKLCHDIDVIILIENNIMFIYLFNLNQIRIE